MTTTKKNPITYLGNPSSQPQQIINQIPNVENSGVKYQGVYKIDKGNGNYELRNQQTRFYSFKISNTVGFDNTFARSEPTKKFFCAFASFDFKSSTSPMQLTIYDQVTSNPKLRVYLGIETNHFNIDLSNCPRMFSGSNIILSTDVNLAPTEWINVNLFGWEED